MESYLNITNLIIVIIGIIFGKIYDLLILFFNKGKQEAIDEEKLNTIEKTLGELEKGVKELDLLINREIDTIKTEKSKFEKEWTEWKTKREFTDQTQDKELSYLKKSYDNILKEVSEIQRNHDLNLKMIFSKIEEINLKLNTLQTLEEVRKNGK